MRFTRALLHRSFCSYAHAGFLFSPSLRLSVSPSLRLSVSPSLYLSISRLLAGWSRTRRAVWRRCSGTAPRSACCTTSLGRATTCRSTGPPPPCCTPCAGSTTTARLGLRTCAASRTQPPRASTPAGSRAEWAKLQEEAAPGSNPSTAASSQQGSRAAALVLVLVFVGGRVRRIPVLWLRRRRLCCGRRLGRRRRGGEPAGGEEAADDWQGGGGDGDGEWEWRGRQQGAALLRLVTGWDLHPDVRRRAMEAAAVAAGVSSVAVAESVPSAEEKEGGGGGSLSLSPLSRGRVGGVARGDLRGRAAAGGAGPVAERGGARGLLSRRHRRACGAAWGALRRWRLWSSSGEAALVQQMVQQVRQQQQQQQQQQQSPSPSGTASQGSSRSSQSHLLRRFALSSVLFRAALANACGAAALSALYGVSGVQFELWRGADWAHDSGRGARPTTRPSAPAASPSTSRCSRPCCAPPYSSAPPSPSRCRTKRESLEEVPGV